MNAYTIALINHLLVSDSVSKVIVAWAARHRP